MIQKEKELNQPLRLNQLFFYIVIDYFFLRFVLDSEDSPSRFCETVSS